VSRVLAELGLVAVAGSQVGGSSGIRGVSGGERRRVTIGMELVIDPSILVLDEPTSGLDSYTAVNLMQTLKQARATPLLPPNRLGSAWAHVSCSWSARAPLRCSPSPTPFSSSWLHVSGLMCPMGPSH
jgi:hypothetical protein